MGQRVRAEVYSACSAASLGAGASNFPALSDGVRNHQVSRKDREPPTQLLMGTLSCSRKYKVMVSDKIENVIMTDGTNRQE